MLKPNSICSKKKLNLLISILLIETVIRQTIGACFFILFVVQSESEHCQLIFAFSTGSMYNCLYNHHLHKYICMRLRNITRFNFTFSFLQIWCYKSGRFQVFITNLQIDNGSGEMWRQTVEKKSQNNANDIIGNANIHFNLPRFFPFSSSFITLIFPFVMISDI